ncbi:MAG: methyltransferase domain-containing protein [Candidatus Zixiibacteriota bacterium]|nr:MAG: methyltransferase domain-containing protein [candidate division Zixibacteria bacterium]
MSPRISGASARQGRTRSTLWGRMDTSMEFVRRRSGGLAHRTKLDRKNLRSGASILDIGCFDGGLLEPLVNRYGCHGIAIHEEAGKRAETKGIRIIGTDFEDVRGRTFDHITGHDVIEHVESPKAFLDLCLTSLNPGGMLLISTGNLDSRTFRLLGSRHWPCHFAEHPVFIGPSWVERKVIEPKFDCKGMFFYSFQHAVLHRRLRKVAFNLFIRFAPIILRGLR